MKHFIRKLITISIIIIAVVKCSLAQNLLSPIWKYNKIDEFQDVKAFASDNWPEINLLLSWERQGHCWIDKNYILDQKFYLNEEDHDLQLEFSLQGDVGAIYINQKQVAGKINNTFWSDGGKKRVVQLPDSLLKHNGRNDITILISNLSYTGGISHNFCSIHSTGSDYENKISIDFPIPNHVYLAEDKKEFTIKSENVSDSKIQFIVNTDDHKDVINKTLNMKKGVQEYPFDLTTYNLKPGFYECILISEGETFCAAVEWFVIEPEEIKDGSAEIPGFDAYWQVALDDLQKIEPDYKVTKIDSLCSETRNGYIIEMKSLGNLTIRGYYFVPKTDGPHPAIMHLPGYSYGFENQDGFIKRKSDCAELALCVRGHGLSKDLFDPWNEMTLWAVNICNRDEYVYRSIYMDCVRAVEFLLSQPEIDHTKIGVMGGSQGGGLALATAGLCNSDVAACAIFDPFLCDIRKQAEIRTIINKELNSFSKYPGLNCDVDRMFDVLDFVDTKYFAPDIKCPVYFSASLFDDDCPSHCGFSAYNSLKGKKKYEVFPKDSHLGESGQYDKLFYELEKMLHKN